MKQFTAMLFAAFALALNGSTMFGQTLTTLATFTGGNGDLPYSGLISDPNGNLYGTTFYGGDYGYGTVFELSAATHIITPLVSFNATNGANPVNYGRLVVDNSGNLYGTTAGGGPNQAGTVFEVAALTHAVTTLASFDPATTGYLPYGGLSADGSGNLYGTTQFGGPGGGGIVFKIDGTHSISVLATFAENSSTSGRNAVSPPVIDSNGNLFGTTGGGGTGGGNGTIYEIDSATHTLTTVATFNGANGVIPTGLIADSRGILYGSARGGGPTNDGVIFEFDPATHNLTTLASFDGTDGSDPAGTLVIDAAGNLYGTTVFGGSGGQGTAFELDSATHAITDLASFDGSNGASPFSSPLLGGDGNLYGTTTGGDFRAFGDGTVFEVALPEPGALSMTGIGALALGVRRRRGRVRRMIYRSCSRPSIRMARSRADR
ncbi:MAG TPA: choice-of-anchor tandem repeat GloVer-containing protein [Tepidisphaeraceae bacterium]|nr:choice-of-anchor tandem repeat GloVer-containing protein [Tepidisphaeraceae bacterium]